MSFEDFLKNRHAENYHGTDDNMPDAYEHWLVSLDYAELMTFAETYGTLRMSITWEKAYDLAIGAVCEECGTSRFHCLGCGGTGRPSNSSVATKIQEAARADKVSIHGND